MTSTHHVNHIMPTSHHPVIGRFCSGTGRAQPGTVCKCICNITKYSSHHHASSQMIPSITDCDNIYHMALHVMTSYWHRHNIHANLFSLPLCLSLSHVIPCYLCVCVFIFIFIFHYISFYTWRFWSWLNATASAKSLSVKTCLRKKKKLVYWDYDEIYHENSYIKRHNTQ